MMAIGGSTATARASRVTGDKTTATTMKATHGELLRLDVLF